MAYIQNALPYKQKQVLPPPCYQAQLILQQLPDSKFH